MRSQLPANKTSHTNTDCPAQPIGRQRRPHTTTKGILLSSRRHTAQRRTPQRQRPGRLPHLPERGRPYPRPLSHSQGKQEGQMSETWRRGGAVVSVWMGGRGQAGAWAVQERPRAEDRAAGALAAERRGRRRRRMGSAAGGWSIPNAPCEGTPLKKKKREREEELAWPTSKGAIVTKTFGERPMAVLSIQHGLVAS